MKTETVKISRDQNIFIRISPEEDKNSRISPDDDPVLASGVRDKILNQATDDTVLERVANAVETIANTFKRRLDSANKEQIERGRISEITFEFGIELRGKVDLLVVGSEGSANFKISIKISL